MCVHICSLLKFILVSLKGKVPIQEVRHKYLGFPLSSEKLQKYFIRTEWGASAMMEV